MTSPRLLGLLCMRNEADRYLRDCITWNAQILDDVFVYDDLSTDNSISVALSAGATVDVRSANVAPFLEHEGEFRQGAWEAFELAMRPAVGDWVLAFDADEFVTFPREINPNMVARSVAEQCHANGVTGCRVKINEVFAVSAEAVSVRTDGFWGDITGVRFFAYRHGGRFATNRRMGCGSAPTYVAAKDCSCSPFELLHYGYARPEDRVAKYQRYHGVPGHNAQHVDSILQDPELTAWQGLVPR